ncbi:MAG: transglycosylase SLT domain-containing protein [Chitinispirillaceae bacterium]|nr:transglycosylase SLT domain-containing protein [Chitinispirillaceae bacterium]
MPYYYLEMVRGSVVGQRYGVPDGAVSIGRSSQNTIALPPAEKSVSGHHAILYKSPERILLQDLQSTNGTYVNNERIAERDLAPGDAIGFGQAGPRLKLIVSDTELDTSAPAGSSAFGDPTSIKTHEEPVPILMSKDATANEDKKNVFKLKQRRPAHSDDTANPSVTVELEQKLIDKSIGQEDMRRLMKEGDRLEKIVKRGNLGETQAATLMSAYRAHRSMRRQLYYIIAAIVFVSVAVSSFFGIRAFQYKHIVTKAKTIKRDLDEFDRKIAAAKNDPEKNRKELQALITQLEEKEKSLSSLKTRMNEDDFGEFYSDPLEKRIDEVLMRFGETDYHIPGEMIDRVRYHIEYYSGNLHATVARYLKRKDKYFPMIHRIFREKNLPIELAYVSMLESGFNPMALSHAGARGLWQFMPKTGRQFGLTVSNNVDDRTDPQKATYAAVEYFKDLIGIFGGKSSVMLCMAAYNAGEGRVMGALRKIDDPMRNRDFWYIYRMGYLAEETNEYIPRVIAFIIISEHPKDYGFSDYVQAGTDTGSLEAETDFVEFDYRIE